MAHRRPPHRSADNKEEEGGGRKPSPDFLDEDGLELAGEVLGPDPALEALAGQDALLGVLEVVRLLALDQALHPARLHRALHEAEGLLQVAVEDLHPDPSPLLLVVALAAAAARRVGGGGGVSPARPPEDGRRPSREVVHFLLGFCLARVSKFG